MSLEALLIGFIGGIQTWYLSISRRPLCHLSYRASIKVSNYTCATFRGEKDYFLMQYISQYLISHPHKYGFTRFGTSIHANLANTVYIYITLRSLGGFVAFYMLDRSRLVPNRYKGNKATVVII